MMNLDKNRAPITKDSQREVRCVLVAIREIRKGSYISLRHCTELACSLERGVYNNYRN